jgi:NAD(P)-dependent dehydrogenase (short-subunit alcohol dehydrogenase family)
MRFDGRVAMITGAATAIGRATAQKFADAGAVVVVIDGDDAGVTETVHSIRSRGGIAEIAAVDVTKRGAMESLVGDVVARHGAIDFFHCHECTLDTFAPITSIEIQAFDHAIHGHVKSAFVALRYALPVMVRQGHGSFVVTCSIAALNGFAHSAASVASNHAVLGLVRAAALDVAAHGVTVNAICQSVAGASAATGFDMQNIQSIRAEEVADLVLFLCSSQARSITGAHFVIDDGQSASFCGAHARASGT